MKYHMGTRLVSVTTDNGANFEAAVAASERKHR